MRRVLAVSAAFLLSSACSSSPAPASPTDAGGETPAPLGPLSLAAGEAAEIPVTDGVGRIKLATPTGTEQYVVILGSTKLDRVTGSYAYSLALDPIDPAVETPATKLDGCALTSADWSKAPAVEPAPTGTAPAVGTTRQLQANGETIDAKVFAVSKTAVVWVDTTAAHPANLDQAFVDAFLKDWDEIILPRERLEFGVESDLDGDGRVGLVFSPTTYATAVAYFTGCDLKTLAGCAAGNHGEFLYLTPPDVIKPPYNTPNAMKEILAHETGHLVHFNRKVLRNKLTTWGDSGYMDEGLGALAQDVIGYQAGNLYVTVAGLAQIDTFSLADIVKDGAQYDSTRDGAMRGGAYLFVRWLYDRAGGDFAAADGTISSKGGPTFLRAMLDDPQSVAKAVGTVGKLTMADAEMDFYTTLAMSNREDAGGVAPKNACFAYLPTVKDPLTTDPRGANLYASFHGQKMVGPKLQSASAADGKLRVGGVELLTLNASAAGELDVSVTVDAAALPRVRVARVK